MKNRIVYFGVAAVLLFSLCGCAAQRGGTDILCTGAGRNEARGGQCRRIGAKGHDRRRNIGIRDGGQDRGIYRGDGQDGHR